MILCLKNTGMPIKKVKQFIDWSMSGDDTIPQKLEIRSGVDETYFDFNS